MISFRKACDLAAEHSLEFIAILGCLACTVLRFSPTDTAHVTYVAKALMHRTSLSNDLMVRAILGTPYGLAPAILARGLAWIYRFTGILPEPIIACLQIVLWTGQAILMFRISERMVKNREAAALATLLYGVDTTLTLSDAAYSATFLERSLCMIPFLWGVGALLEGKRWKALIGNCLATYLHAQPAIYLWPLLLLEDFLEALRHPESRTGTWLRLAALFLLLFPFYLAVTLHNPLSALNPDLQRMILVIQPTSIAGLGYFPGDYLFMAEGVVLIALAAYRLRDIAAMPLLLRAAGLCVVMMVVGRVSFLQAQKSWSALWWIPVRTLPWISAVIMQIFGQILLAALLALDFRANARLVPAILLILTQSSYAGHDFVLFFFAIGLVVCMLCGRRRIATGLILGMGLIPFAYALSPGTFHQVGRLLGLRGGIFNLAAFRVATAWETLGCLVIGLWLEKLPAPRPSVTMGAAALIFFLSMAGIGFQAEKAAQGQQHQAILRMAVWIRNHTPADAIILGSPVYIFAIESFMATSERSVFCSFNNATQGFKYGGLFAGLAERLRALGFDSRRVRDENTIGPEIERIDREFTPELASRLARQYGVTHVLLTAERAWPGTPVHREEGVVLYSVAYRP